MQPAGQGACPSRGLVHLLGGWKTFSFMSRETSILLLGISVVLRRRAQRRDGLSSIQAESRRTRRGVVYLEGKAGFALFPISLRILLCQFSCRFLAEHIPVTCIHKSLKGPLETSCSLSVLFKDLF